MLDEPVIVAYHANVRVWCERFLREGCLITSKEDGQWLGEGMYFWDNMSNAKYWLKEKKRKCPQVEHWIVQGNICLGKMLDLTNTETVETVDQLWEQYCNKLALDENARHSVPLGKKLNALFMHFPTLANLYNVIRVYGKYNRTPKGNLFFYDLNSPKPEPINNIKCIYSARTSDCLRNFEKAEW